VRNLLAVLALLAVVAAGCGGAAQTQSAERGVPLALAHGWEDQAAAIAAAASTGDDCRASQLATTLRDQVVASQRKVPPRLRSSLLAGVNALADRIACTPPAPAPPPPKPPKPPHDKHEDHGHHGHGHGGDGNGP
jgi:hypothetical protein